jgi:hypothetical protein
VRHSEDAEQKLLFDWAAYQPKLQWMFAIPNGGNRSIIEAKRLKACGVKAGVADIFLPVISQPCYGSERGYAGLFIEMKRRRVDGKSRVSDKQSEFMERMAWEGYRCEVCYGADEAIKVIDDYLKLC